MRNKVSDGYNFWLYAPNEYYEYPDDVFPVIIFLHGQSCCGNDMMRSRRYGVLDAIDMGRHVEALVINPQNPGGGWKPDKINNILNWVLENYRADPYKVYVIGMSLGGYGTMDFVGTYPEKVTAAMALCGGCTLKDVQGLGNLPFWILHGTGDAAINVSESKNVVSALQRQGNDKLLRFDWLSGASHGRLARIFYLPQVYEWFSLHDKLRNPDEVDRNISITLSDMSDAYNGLNTHGGSIATVNYLEP
jgi:predicted peptidase